MSWARFGADRSDVYLFPTTLITGQHVAECCACNLRTSPAEFYFHTTDLAEWLAHLGRHRAAGHTVPDYAYTESRADWDEFMGPVVTP